MNCTDRMFEQASGAGRQAPAWKRKLFLLLGGLAAMSLVLAGCAGMPTADSLTPPVALMQEAAKCVAAEAEKAAKQKPADAYSFKDEQNMLTAKAIDGMVAISTKFADSNQQGTHQCFAVVKAWMEQRGASERQVVAMYQSISNTAGVALQWGVGGWAVGHVLGKAIGGGQTGSTYNVNGETFNDVNIASGARSQVGTGGSALHGSGNQQNAGESLIGRDSKTSTDTVTKTSTDNANSFNTTTPAP